LNAAPFWGAAMMMRLFLAALVSLLPLSLCEAGENPLLGAWRLTSFVRVLADGGSYDQLGPRPDGYILYTSDGRMSALLVDSDRAAPKQTPPTEAERAALHGSMIAYAGTYRIEGNKVIHHIEVAWDQARIGSDQVRYFELRGDQLLLRTPTNKGPLDGKEGVGILTFERASSR
jgi:hypothetical protein